MQAATKLKYDNFINYWEVLGFDPAKAKEAAIQAHYSPDTIANQVSRMLNNDYVIQEISKRQAKLAVKAGMTLKKIQTMYLEDRDFATRVNQAGARVSATTGIARVCGFDKDGGKDGTVTVVNVINYAGVAGVKPPKSIVGKEIVNE